MENKAIENIISLCEEVDSKYELKGYLYDNITRETDDLKGEIETLERALTIIRKHIVAEVAVDENGRKGYKLFFKKGRDLLLIKNLTAIEYKMINKID